MGSTLTSRIWSAIHGDLHKPQIVLTTNLHLGFTASVRCTVHLKTLENIRRWRTCHSEGLALFIVGDFGCPEIRTLKINRFENPTLSVTVLALACGFFLSCRRAVGKGWRELLHSSLNCSRRVSQNKTIPLSISSSAADL